MWHTIVFFWRWGQDFLYAHALEGTLSKKKHEICFLYGVLYLLKKKKYQIDMYFNTHQQKQQIMVCTLLFFLASIKIHIPVLDWYMFLVFSTCSAAKHVLRGRACTHWGDNFNAQQKQKTIVTQHICYWLNFLNFEVLLYPMLINMLLLDNSYF